MADSWYAQRIDEDSGEIYYELHEGENDGFVIVKGRDAKIYADIILEALVSYQMDLRSEL